ncbi:MAG: NAD(P)H-dependent glycerol-3-phosphate dehydrogenase, partial [uncultured bacterium]
MKKICVLGGGAFGTAIACLLADNRHEVNIWCCEPDVVESINLKNINNTYLPDIKLSENILAFTDLGLAISDCEIIFEAVPVKYLRSVLEKAKPYFNNNQVWVCCSKGIENETLLFPWQTIDSVFGESVKKVVISGPSYAKEIAQKQITAVDIASQDKIIAEQVSQLLMNDYFKVVITQDIFGVQIGGALKNVVAIGVGILDGLGYKENTKALFLNLCLQEMMQISEIFGAQRETIYGLSGVADLVATCYGGSSKNYKFGFNLSKGAFEAVSIDKKVIAYGLQGNGPIFPEGVNTARSFNQIIKLINNIGVKEFRLKYNILLDNSLVIRDYSNFCFPV